jgi:iron-sulfur cluster assembly protein
MAQMDSISTQKEHSIRLTAAASARLQKMIEERDLHGHALRVFVSGGGCSGMQYGMALEGQPREDDHRFDVGGLSVVIDPGSLPHLAGSTIDYKDEMMGGGFQIDNPNAVASCGCGHSFRTASGAGHGASGAGCGCH